jgi:hypothetical protein
MENKKSYYAIIPANVRYDKSLSANAKLLYGEITALCNEKGYCWATNRYFSALYNVHNNTISTWVQQLKKNNYINIKIIYKPDSKEILERRISLSIINLPPINEIIDSPINENREENNTSFNTKGLNCESEGSQALPGFKDIDLQPENIKPEKLIKNGADNKAGKQNKEESPELKDFKKRMKQNINVACHRYNFDPIYWDAKQNIQFNNLIKRVLFLSGGDIEKARILFIKLLETFASCRNGDKWWRSKPFTPAAMIGLFDNIMAQKEEE